MERQYIGARYVPKFWDNGSGSTDWTPNIPYESMVVVTYMNNSYTSKVPVPATQIAPNVDTEHWALTGAYNAQVEQYRQDVIKLEQKVNSLFVNVKDFGAVGDGVHDDTVAFNSAMAGGNKTVFIPRGTYLVTDTVNIESGTIIECEGTITHKVNTGNYKSTFEAHNASNIEIHGVKMVGTGAVNQAAIISCCILFDTCENVRVCHSEFEEIQSGYVICFKSCDTVYAENNKINKYTRSGIASINGTSNVYYSDNTVIDCVNTTEENTYPIMLCGYDQNPPVGTPAPKNLNAFGNYIKNSIPWWEGIDSHGGDGVKVIGNTIIGCYSGIGVFDSSDINVPGSNFTITNNYVELGTDTTYSKNAKNCGCTVSGKNVIVSNNIFKNCGKLLSQIAGAYCDAIYCTEAENAVFANNLIYDSVGNCFDIRACDNLYIDGNLIDTISGISNSSSCYIFQLDASTDNKTIIAHHNVVKNATNMTLYYGNSHNINELYINITNNDLEGVTKNLQTRAISDGQINTTSITMGHVGDIVMRGNPAVGQPIGWICTADWVNGAGGVWTPMPNL